MNALAGYRTLALNALMLIAGLVGLKTNPEVIQRHVEIAFSIITAVNVFMRIITTGPVGPAIAGLVPQAKHLAKSWDALQTIAAALANRPGTSISQVVISSTSTEPVTDVPAPAAPGQDDVLALLPIYAAAIATAANQTLSETVKAQ
jgi:hypothetical protein